MSLFRRKTKFDYRTDFLPQGGKFRHLDRIADLNKVVVREPKMDESTVVFLPYPDFSAADYKTANRVAPDLLDDTDTRSVGPWMFAAEGVRYFGKNPVSLLFDNPDDSGFIPQEHHPVYMVYEAVFRAVKSKSVVTTPMGSSVSDTWDVLLNGQEGANNSYGCLNPPGPLTLAYCLAYSLGKENYQGASGTPLGGAAGDKPVILMMTKTTTRTLLEAFDGHFEDTRVPRQMTGCLAVHFYDRQKGVCSAKAAGAAGTAFALGGRRAPAVGSQGATAQLAGYGVYLSNTLSGRDGDPVLPRQIFIQQAVRQLRPWEEVLRGHTPEECARVVADQCGLPMSVLYHAWKSRPEFYTDEMRTAMRNPTSQSFGLGRPAADAQEAYAHPAQSQPAAALAPAVGAAAPAANPFGLGGYDPGASADAMMGQPPGHAPTYPPGQPAGFAAAPTHADPGYDTTAQAALQATLDAELDRKFHERLRNQQPPR